ncbi:hypothetical protein Shyd_19230 [Streptomyces hydrogenans]|uniref:Uncharacterized protein n=1 Tax=Streptomyces hydrogenans TaxID=1873719 RepID=A0ABQ3P6D2_9ACTN|nr:hypothetical protein Shyd_19230 [Streptomyces hydrogenans]
MGPEAAAVVAPDLLGTGAVAHALLLLGEHVAAVLGEEVVVVVAPAHEVAHDDVAGDAVVAADRLLDGLEHVELPARHVRARALRGVGEGEAQLLLEVLVLVVALAVGGVVAAVGVVQLGPEVEGALGAELVGEGGGEEVVAAVLREAGEQPVELGLRHLARVLLRQRREVLRGPHGVGGLVPVGVLGVAEALLGLVNEGAQDLGGGAVALGGAPEDAVDPVADAVDGALLDVLAGVAVHGLGHEVLPGGDDGDHLEPRRRDLPLQVGLELLQFAEGVADDVADGGGLGVRVAELARGLVDELPADLGVHPLPVGLGGSALQAPAGVLLQLLQVGDEGVPVGQRGVQRAELGVQQGVEVHHSPSFLSPLSSLLP